MNKDPVIEQFYSSRAWRNCRKSFMKYKGGLCERCLSKGLIEPATQVHHKVHLTSETIKDPSVTLNHKNLMALCDKCHSEMHHSRRWRCDATGRVTI